MPSEIDPYDPHTTAVYRLFTTPGALLYVGVATHPGVRFEQHSADKDWWHAVAYREIQWYSTREEALAAEAVAIQTELPAFNKAGTAGRPASGGRSQSFVTEWTDWFAQNPPAAHTLEELFTVMVQVESLPPGAYHPWSAKQAREVWALAYQAAGHWAKCKHLRYVDRYNTRIEAAWHRHAQKLELLGAANEQDELAPRIPRPRRDTSKVPAIQPTTRKQTQRSAP